MSVIIQNVHGSKLGNMMIKYMVAVKLAEKLGDARISGYELKEWNIKHAHIDAKEGERCITLAPPSREMELNFDRASYLASTGLIHRINLAGHVQRIENFPDLEHARNLFPDNENEEVGYPGHVVCPIRGAEILDAIHPGYTLLPIRFYRQIIAELGKPPAFIGQIGDDSYSDALRAAFPKARYEPNAGAMHDFAAIRRAEAIIVSVSTFSWLAAWLSHATTIVLPSFGLFNRDRFPEHDLLPLGDERYRFYSFPVQDAVPLDKVAASHEELTWRQVSAAELLKPH